MKVIELFAGIGSQTQALKNIGVESFKRNIMFLGLCIGERDER